MQTDYRGIDYGMGSTNIDIKANIRFGVIPFHDVLQAWSDSSEPYYGEFGEDEELPDFAEPISFFYDKEYYLAEQSADSCDIFITKSPFYTHAQFCSPCAPGACYLRNECDDGEKAYCLGHDWFEDGKAPYKVYSVETGMEVFPA